MNQQFPTVWRLIDRFKEHCQLRGWETCETEDLIRTEDGKYHSFLWTKTIRPSTFERIAANRKCGIRSGDSYEVVDISYMAWLFQERPPEFFKSFVEESSELAQRIAIFDLSCVYTGENVCHKFNETESSVLMEFEQFLVDNWGIVFSPVTEMPALTP
ncbi:MAG: hypothetical protein CW716_03365 [Candidatus Bathyarchaeum sp.]|nr:MAG: hypothetical protein CW716_03365 [Candidatus Bathyarchaeum sp.]